MSAQTGIEILRELTGALSQVWGSSDRVEFPPRLNAAFEAGCSYVVAADDQAEERVGEMAETLSGLTPAFAAAVEKVMRDVRLDDGHGADLVAVGIDRIDCLKLLGQLLEDEAITAEVLAMIVQWTVAVGVWVERARWEAAAQLVPELDADELAFWRQVVRGEAGFNGQPQALLALLNVSDMQHLNRLRLAYPEAVAALLEDREAR